MKKLGLLPRIVIAIVMGVLIGNVLPEAWVRIFVTFNGMFSQFLGFLIPLIIIGLVTPAIADIGRSAGRLLLLTIGLAYADTIIAGLLAFGTGTMLFPMLIDTQVSMAVEKTEALQPYFELQIPAILAGVLGFNPEAQALIVALYIAMDSFGTACNVTGDGALAVIIDKLHKSH